MCITNGEQLSESTTLGWYHLTDESIPAKKWGKEHLDTMNTEGANTGEPEDNEETHVPNPRLPQDTGITTYGLPGN